MTLQERSDNAIGQGCSTFSKHQQSYIHGPNLPTHVVSNDAVSIMCDNGQSYVDCGCLGSGLIAVHNNFSLPHIKEVELAEKLNARLGTERIKFLKTGSDACMQACRFARAYATDKTSHIVWAGYHGTADIFISQEHPGAGVPHMHSTKLGSIHELADYCRSKKFRDKPPAAVIWEGVVLEDSDRVRRDNEEIIESCRAHGVVSILDEVVTGGRVPKFCVKNYYGLQPDLLVMGKGLGDGVPISLIAGPERIIDNRDVFCSNTHNGSLDAMMAGLESLEMLTDERIQTLWTMGAMLIDQFNKLKAAVKLHGVPTRFSWKGSPEDISRFWKGLADRGFWCSISMFPKLSWIDGDIFSRFLEASMDVVAKWREIDMTGVETYKSWFKRY
jgi:adenosylmethionine-8-amino-7-oxononanoate aminotransferase